MANSSLLNSIAISAIFFTFIFVFIISPSDVGATSGIDDRFGGWMTSTKAQETCTGSIAECMAGEDFEMDSESNRRILATSNYISYGSLQGNTVPCSQRGASYYNCQSGGQANPYERGCSTITRCQR